MGGVEKPRILAHLCCAPDSLYVVGLLQAEYRVTGFFYNPNIQPREEYLLRLEELSKVARTLGFKLIEEPPDEERWLELTAKFRKEPEMGRRCLICYAMRLKRTAETAARDGFDLFTTIMSVSPRKKAEALNRMGTMLGRRHGVPFLEANFKKKDGFKKSVELSRAHGLYRQDYCGCLFSRRSETHGS
jgi:predicted adenine nucleotide alpha hydrolase (AANH) superfamily ATPase